MTNPVVAFPTLGQTTYLTTPQDIIASIIQYYAYAPKSASDVYFAEAISLADTLSKYGYTRDVISGPVIHDLVPVLNRYFPGHPVNVDVSYEDIDTVRYNLVITVTVSVDGSSYTASTSLVVDSNHNIIVKPTTGL